MTLDEIMNNFCTDKKQGAEEDTIATYKNEVLSVYEGGKALGFVARRHLVFGVHKNDDPGWCVMKPFVNIWEGEFSTREEAGEALQGYGKKRNHTI